MGISNQEAIKQFQSLMDQVDESLKKTFQNMHQGYPSETLVRFLKARDWNVAKAHKMLLDCLRWRIDNGIDAILEKPIVPMDLYRAIRDSYLVGMSGYSKELCDDPAGCVGQLYLGRPRGTMGKLVLEIYAGQTSVWWGCHKLHQGFFNGTGLPVFAIAVGLSTYDKASVHYYVQSHIQMNEYRDRVVLPSASKKYGRPISTCLKVLDMTGLRISALNQIKLLTAISTIDDLNYPEKTDTYYIVNAPYIFSACWKVVKPLLQERTRRKIQVLQGCGRDELLNIMDYSSLPHFCTKEGSGSSRHRGNGTIESCFSLDHPFHQKLYNYVKQQAELLESVAPIREGSVHVHYPEPAPEDALIAQTLETELHRLGDLNGLSKSLSGVKV